MKNILAFALIVFAILLLASNFMKSEPVESQLEGAEKEQIDDVYKLPKEAIPRQPINLADNTQPLSKPLSSNIVHASSLMEPRPTGVVELTLTPDNVPEPFIAFERNTNLTWQDFKEIKRRFEQEEGQPFDYYRKPDGKLDWNHWWVERIGVNEQGEDIYRLTDLLSFTENSLEILSNILEGEFDQLYHQTEYGNLSPELENYAREAFPEYLQGSTVYSVSPIVCRQMKCLMKATYDKEEARLDIFKYSERLEEYMESTLNNGYRCSGSWDPAPPNGNIIRVECENKDTEIVIASSKF